MLEKYNITYKKVSETDRILTCGEYGWARLELIFGKGLESTYGTLVFALQYCLPLTVLIITYAAIGVRIWNSDVPGSESSRGILKDRHGSVKRVSYKRIKQKEK